MGYNAGNSSQNSYSIAIGTNAGNSSQNSYSIAIGTNAGNSNQNSNAIAIGKSCGYINQNENTIALGINSGFTGQQQNSIAIGTNAGQSNQGSNCIAIGVNAGQNNQFSNSIILNASNSNLNSISSGFYVSPIATNNNLNNPLLTYNTTTSEITYSTKTFVIEHPINNSKYLVHACLEGPEGGVYYRGINEISNGEFIEIELPDYVEKLATEFTCYITPIYDSINKNKIYETTEISNCKFKVYGPNGKFNWIVYGKRINIECEPNKIDIEIGGTGPYLYIKK